MPDNNSPALPEPFARISSVMGKVMLFDAPDFTMRKGDAIFTADQMREYAQEAARQAIERIAGMCDEVYELRAKQGFPREASMARRIRDEIRALTNESEKRHGH